MQSVNEELQTINTELGNSADKPSSYQLSDLRRGIHLA
jgi:hypothetical protein